MDSVPRVGKYRAKVRDGRRIQALFANLSPYALDLSDHPILHHQPPIRHLRQLLVVRHDHEGLADFFPQIEEQLV